MRGLLVCAGAPVRTSPPWLHIMVAPHAFKSRTKPNDFATRIRAENTTEMGTYTVFDSDFINMPSTSSEHSCRG